MPGSSVKPVSERLIPVSCSGYGERVLPPVHTPNDARTRRAFWIATPTFAAIVAMSFVRNAEDIEELSAADLPAEHVEDYFALRFARPNDHTLVVGSTGFGDLDWQPLPPECVTAVSMLDLSMSLLPLETD